MIHCLKNILNKKNCTVYNSVGLEQYLRDQASARDTVRRFFLMFRGENSYRHKEHFGKKSDSFLRYPSANFALVKV